MTNEHTPLPWKKNEHGSKSAIVGPNWQVIGGCHGRPVEESEANAALIVRAVNTIDTITEQRDRLLEACKDANEKLTAEEWRADGVSTEIAKRLRKAIAECEGAK